MLLSIPDSLPGTGIPARPQKINLSNSSYYLDNPDKKYHENDLAVFFGTIISTIDTTIQIGVSADWWMEWFINGDSVYNTLETGNGKANFIVIDHLVKVPVKKGANLLAAKIHSGNEGWKFIIGFQKDIESAFAAIEKQWESQGIRYMRDLPYLGNDRNEKMDLYLPAGKRKNKLPVMIYVHGGGFGAGDKCDHFAIKDAKMFIAEGFAYCSINYALNQKMMVKNEYVTLKAAWPQNLYDCKSAIRYIRKNADRYGLDSSRIALHGLSAGGHLVLLTAYTADDQSLNTKGLYTEYSSKVNCIISNAGIADVRGWGGEVFCDYGSRVDTSVLRLASPVCHISKNSPPTLILVGETDSPEEALDFSKELCKDSVLNMIIMLPEFGHGIDFNSKEITIRPVVFDFLRKYLGIKK
jgi:acetyl esterase/lipase